MDTESDEPPALAVLVGKPRSQAAIAALRDEGVYDDDRGVREWNEDCVAIPVTDVPTETAYREVIHDHRARRKRGLEDHLRERGWTDAEIDRAPSSWAVVGSVILVSVGDDVARPGELGDALLALHGEADTVLDRGGIAGPHREPDVTVIAGEGDTETVHREHGTTYAMDLADVMFSPGNKAERARMGEIVREATSGRDGGERVLDMFAGIGYFTLPMARAGATVTAVERNPTSFQYLVENAMANGVSDRVQPYRADCRDVVPAFAEEAPADRVVMGYYDAHEYLDSALDAVAIGGTIHVHEATPNDLVFERPIQRLEDAASSAGRSVEILATREVKGYSEGVAHVVVDARIE